MPPTDPVAGFITENNAVLKELEKLLRDATNPSRGYSERTRALDDAGHLACQSLKRLHDADGELWQPIQEPPLRVYLDQDLVLRSEARGPYEAPKAPVKQQLFELFRHPRVDEVADLIRRADRELEQVVRDLGEGLGAVIQRAKGLVDQLRVETCHWQAKKAPWHRRVRTIRMAAGVIAMSSLAAAVPELVKWGWDVSPEVLRRIAELLQHMGHSLDSLPVLGLLAVTTMGQDAERALREEWPAWASSDRDDPPKGHPSRTYPAGEQPSGQPIRGAQSMDPPGPASDQGRDVRDRRHPGIPPAR
jgi:hypothetical protein